MALGRFKNSIFRPTPRTSQAYFGGEVKIGPLSKTENTVGKIRRLAFTKFCQINQRFGRLYESETEFTVVYSDGKQVEKLPDGTTEFSLYGLRQYIDPKMKYERIKLFLCLTCKLHIYPLL